MSKVRYRWSERSKADLCECEDIITKGEYLCYHCGTPIPAGSEAVLLTTDRNENYVLHKGCADKSCTAVSSRKQRKLNHNGV